LRNNRAPAPAFLADLAHVPDESRRPNRRRIRHLAVTAPPTGAWTAQQLRETFPCDEAPRYLIHDRDHAFDRVAATAQTMGIDDVPTAPYAPWQNAFVERFIGSARCECFDHVIAFNEAGMHKLMTLYCSYYERSRTHSSMARSARLTAATHLCGDPEGGGSPHWTISANGSSVKVPDIAVCQGGGYSPVRS
jgi:Integrase core domain